MPARILYPGNRVTLYTLLLSYFWVLPGWACLPSVFGCASGPGPLGTPGISPSLKPLSLALEWQTLNISLWRKKRELWDLLVHPFSQRTLLLVPRLLATSLLAHPVLRQPLCQPCLGSLGSHFKMEEYLEPPAWGVSAKNESQFHFNILWYV